EQEKPPAPRWARFRVGNRAFHILRSPKSPQMAKSQRGKGHSRKRHRGPLPLRQGRRAIPCWPKRQHIRYEASVTHSPSLHASTTTIAVFRRVVESIDGKVGVTHGNL